MMMGQCHRYIEYEMLPMYWLTGFVSTPTARCSAAPQPAAITSAVASTGRAAAGPGNGDSALIRKSEAVMPARPIQARTGRSRAGSRVSQGRSRRGRRRCRAPTRA